LLRPDRRHVEGQGGVRRRAAPPVGRSPDPHLRRVRQMDRSRDGRHGQRGLMSARLATLPLEDGAVYFSRFPEKGPGEKAAGPAPRIHPDAQVHDCVLGPWVRVGARTSLSEVTMGAYSYIVTDSSAAYAEIGKFCSI